MPTGPARLRASPTTLDAKVLVVATYQAEGLAEGIVAARHGATASGSSARSSPPCPRRPWQSVRRRREPSSTRLGVPLLGALPALADAPGPDRRRAGRRPGRRDPLRGRVGRQAGREPDARDHLRHDGAVVLPPAEQQGGDRARRPTRRAHRRARDRDLLPDRHRRARTRSRTSSGWPPTSRCRSSRSRPTPPRCSTGSPTCCPTSASASGTSCRRSPSCSSEHFDFAALRRGLGLRQEATP